MIKEMRLPQAPNWRLSEKQCGDWLLSFMRVQSYSIRRLCIEGPKYCLSHTEVVYCLTLYPRHTLSANKIYTRVHCLNSGKKKKKIDFFPRLFVFNCRLYARSKNLNSCSGVLLSVGYCISWFITWKHAQHRINMILRIWKYDKMS